MTFEMWVNKATPVRAYERIFDCGDDVTNDIQNGDAIAKYNIWVGVSGDVANNGLGMLHYYGNVSNVSYNQLNIANALVPGTWQLIHATLTTHTPTSATMKVYINGVLRGSLATQPAPMRMRRSCSIARSNWDDPAFNGALDQFNYYNYALTLEQIQLHMALSHPPHFDASFDSDPQQVSRPLYGWSSGRQPDGTLRSQISFNGMNQFVDLNAGSGNASIGQSFPLVNGPSFGIDQNGFSFELSCLWTSVASNSKVFDLANGRSERGGIDSIAIGNRGSTISLFIHNGLTDERAVIDMFDVIPGIFYHMVIVATPVFNRTDIMDYKVYHSGNEVLTVTSQVAPLFITRRTSYLARSNTRGESMFSGAIDLLRYYKYRVNAGTARTLYERQTSSGAYIAPGQAPQSSSSSSATPSIPTSPSVPTSSRPAIPSSTAAPQPPSSTASSQSSSTTSPVTSTGPVAVPSESSSSSLGSGSIAAIVLGVLMGVMLCCFAMFFLCFSGRSNKSVKLEEDHRHHEEEAEPSQAYDGETTVEMQNV